jgi:hypothetical protein
MDINLIKKLQEDVFVGADEVELSRRNPVLLSISYLSSKFPDLMKYLKSRGLTIIISEDDDPGIAALEDIPSNPYCNKVPGYAWHMLEDKGERDRLVKKMSNDLSIALEDMANEYVKLKEDFKSKDISYTGHPG